MPNYIPKYVKNWNCKDPPRCLEKLYNKDSSSFNQNACCKQNQNDHKNTFPFEK